MIRKWIQIAGGSIGASLVLSMIFANQLGLDKDPAWGGKRYILFIIGLLIFAVSFFYRENNFIGHVFHTPAGWTHLSVAALSGMVILGYIWYISAGLWTSWPNETSYYDLLATAFSQGQLAVDIQPHPALLTMENVYEPSNREGIPVLWDASLYKGKYYLYWGPAPALFLAIFKLFSQEPIGDKVITFVYVTGAFIFSVLLILELWKKYFVETPLWALLSAIAFAGLANPILYILLEARIYEAAIIAAQFFLLGGMYWMFTAFSHSSKLRLALAGIFLALAVGSRTTLTFSVAFLALMVLVWAVKAQKARAVSLVAAFSAPLVLGAISYAVYNYARFDSFTEFGLHYQLTSYNLYELLGETFSPAYIPPNLYKTLFNPLETRDVFPYIIPNRWAGPDWLAGEYPKFYLLLAEAITGIFAASPFMIFAFLAGLNKDKTFRWILLSLTGAAFFVFLMLQFFFFTTMRYLLDLVPTLSLLAVIGFWQGLAQLKAHPAARRMYSTFAIALLIYSIAIGLILPISGHLESYRVFNPALLEQITWRVNALMK
ncbi:MAG: hypothetical protein IH588_00105 [Anaerolineales bacterium]|nr:hypothetical protein [Anaerolineales bacterium]